jgi:molybdopterin-dependent oxidoreductase alpha subunit
MSERGGKRGRRPGEHGAAKPKEWATGLPAIISSMEHGLGQMGATRTARTFLRLNQTHGFDCPSCAWPDPDPANRRPAEFCESGAKAVAWEATDRRVDRAFFAKHSVADLHERSEWWLGQQGRLTEPMYKPAGGTHYQPIGWDAAYDVIARHLTALDDPNDAFFYTSGRTSNEAAFLYQLMVRAYGTNNLPDCSNMCHESSGKALTSTIGIGKGAVTLDSLEHSELIIICGQNTGTTAPRMLTHLEAAKKNGARVIAVNPLPEAGLMRFKNPQSIDGILGSGTPIADLYLPIRLSGDKALFQAVGARLIELDEMDPGSVLDRDFIHQHTTGYFDYAEHVRSVDWTKVEEATGLRRDEIESFTQEIAASRATVVAWTMGLTQHQDAVATIREVVNVLLLQGNVGKEGAGPLPVRGHSNVQGDRTMGIWEKMPDTFMDALGKEFAFEPPREHGAHAVETVQRLREHAVRVFFSMGGNFATATPDTDVVLDGLAACDLTVQVSTKLNRSHTATGNEALILPVRGRTDKDETSSGLQSVTVEDSQGQVHASKGRLDPPSELCKSEPTLVAELAERLVGNVGSVPWADFATDYSRIRDSISRVIPGFDDFNHKIERPGGFLLPHPPRDERVFKTSDGRAHFTTSDLHVLPLPAGRLLLQTIRSHDQFNTTVYGHDDRYRGVHGNRRVVLVNPDDLHGLGFHAGDVVDLVSEWDDGERRAEQFTLMSYPSARGCAAAYFPETNVLVPADHMAAESFTPVSKSIVVRFERRPAMTT